MKHKLLSILLSLVMVLSLLPTAALAEGSTINVAPNETEAGAKTLTTALSEASDGTTIVLAEGTYTGTFTVLADNVTIKAAAGTDGYAAVTIVGGINAADKKNLTVEGITFDGTNDAGRAIVTGDGFTVKNCIFNGLYMGVRFEATSQAFTHGTVENCVFDGVALVVDAFDYTGGVTENDNRTFTFNGNKIKDTKKVECNPTVQVGNFVGVVGGSTYNGNGIETVVFSGNEYLAESPQVVVWVKNVDTITRTNDGDNVQLNITPNKAAKAESENKDTVAYYATLAAALTGAEDGDTVTMLKNVEFTGASPLFICNKSITLDMWGYDIKKTDGGTALCVYNYGKDNTDIKTVTITNTDSCTEYDSDITVSGGSGDNFGVYVWSGGKVVLGGDGMVNVTAERSSNEKSTNCGVYVQGGWSNWTQGATHGDPAEFTLKSNAKIAAENGYGVLVQGGVANYSSVGNDNKSSDKAATFIMTGGTIEDAEIGISGTADYGSADTTITVTGGTISNVVAAIYHPQNGTLNISGGTLSGATAVEMKAGTANISDGTFTDTYVSEEAPGRETDYGSKSDGNSTNGYAFAVLNNGSAEYRGNVVANLTGGKFNGPVALYTEANSKAEKTAKLNISGGTYTGAVTLVDLRNSGDEDKVEITGGTFNTDPSEYAAGKCVTENDGKKYEVAAHKLTATPEKAVTCVELGNTAYWSCSVCKKMFSDAECLNETDMEKVVQPKSTEHKYGTGWETNETKHWHACTVTGCTAKGDEAEHNYGNDNICDTCGYDKSHKHNLTKVEATAATCTTPGNEAYWKCSGCGKIFSDGNGNNETTKDDVTIAAGHTLTENEAKAATKTAEGNLAYWYCSVCQKYFKDAAGTEEYATNGWKLAKLPSGGSSSGGSSSSSSKTSTTTNKDGSATTTTTKSDGTKVETTTAKDGTKTVVESKTTTAANGTKTATTTETVTAKDGRKTEVKTETVTAKDGSTTETTTEKVTTADGSIGTTTTKTNAQGNTTVEVEASVSTKAVETAQKTNEAVTVPVEVKATTDSKTAPVVSVSVPKSAGEVKVEIPVTKLNSGTVAVIVNADGTEEIVKTCAEGENGVILNVSVNVTVKIVDNSKNFNDTVSHWSKNEVNFVAARGIFNGVGSDDFGVSAPMTRGMVNTVLARLSGANTEGGETWYTKGNEWAVANGVSDGTNPTGDVTREQLATMLYRYAGSPAVTGTLSFTDADSVSGYAQNALLWASQVGIIGGLGDGSVAPTAGAERAQVAAMLARYIQLVG